MVGFYKHDIPAWMDGTEGLSDGAYRAYHVIVQLIMLNEGPVALNERGIAGRCNQTLKLFLRHLNELVSAGKLVVEDGRISNARASRELEFVHKNRENAGKGGKISGQQRKTSAELQNQTANPLENNDQPEAPLHKDRSLKEKRREDTPVVPTGTDPEGFSEFWQAYPKRDGDNPRKTAARAYGKALRGGAEPAALLHAVRALAAEMQSRGKLGTELVPMAATWLNQGRFERFTDPASAPSGQPSSDPAAFLAKITEADWRGYLRRWRDTGGQWLLDRKSAPPDDPKTKAPPHLLAEIGIRHSVERPTLALLTGTG